MFPVNITAVKLPAETHTDYWSEMIKVVEKGGDNAFSEGKRLEDLRNEKISRITDPGNLFETNFFDGSMTLGEIRYEMGISAYIYSDYELTLLAKLIDLEMGASWAPDWAKKAVGSVVLNRVNSPSFPNSIKDVIFQPGQYYSCDSKLFLSRVPSQKSMDIAKELLNKGGTLPSNVIFQANFRQGSGVYSSYYDPVLGNWTYFCY